MFKHLLVPLDGSPQAEAAVPAAMALAAKNAANVTLLHVIEARAPRMVHGVAHLREAGEADAYLDAVAQRYAAGGLTPATHVHGGETSDVAQGLVAHLAELGCDTVVMSRHGRVGWRGLRLGTIAQQAAAGGLPVLLVRPPPGLAAGPAFRRILIPHDQEPRHEPALPVGMELARLCGAEVLLLRVVPTRGALAGAQGAAGGLLPAATEAMLDLERAEAVRHLAADVEQWRKAGVTVSQQVARGDPVRGILKTAAEYAADIVVLGTHGHAGTKAFWEGSVAAKVCNRSTASILLVPLK